MSLTHDGSKWNAVCRGTTTEMGPEGTTTQSWTYDTVQGPRSMSPTMAVGTVTNTKPIFMPAWGGNCELTEWIVRVDREAWHTTGLMAGDDAYVLRALEASEADDHGDQSLDMSWEKELGLVLDWRRAGRMSQMTYYEGTLVSTDAPIT
jgi:hypothetical protein